MERAPGGISFEVDGFTTKKPTGRPPARFTSNISKSATIGSAPIVTPTTPSQTKTSLSKTRYF